MAGRAERLGRAALEQYSATPLFNTKAVVRQTGVPAPTLRAWERRYGILVPYRGENDYRLYSERDIAIIRWLREEVRSGLTISQAIARLRTFTHPPPISPTSEPPNQASNGASPHDQPPAWQHQADEQSATRAVPTSPSRQIDQAEALTTALLHAFIRLDETEVARLLARAFAMFTVEQVVIEIMQPVLAALGDQWARGAISITSEHFASAFLRSQLEALYRSEPMPATGPLVLVGCAPGELHELGPLSLALLLRRLQRGLRVIYLGQNVEPTHLLESVQVVRPAVVCLSAALPTHRQAIGTIAHMLAALPAVQHPMLVFGGQAFLQEPTSAAEIEGIFLNQDAITAAASIQELCGT